MAPITLLWGPQIGVRACCWCIGLAGTAFGWYWVFSRHLVDNRPGRVRRRRALRVRAGPGQPRPGPRQLDRPVRRARAGRRGPAAAAGPGTAVAARHRGSGCWSPTRRSSTRRCCSTRRSACACSSLCYALLQRPRAVEDADPRVPAAAWPSRIAVAVALLAYPLWVQFFGPQSYHGVPDRGEGRQHRPRRVPRVRPALDRRQHRPTAERLAQGPAEENSFLGWPLLIVCLAWPSCSPGAARSPGRC